MIRHSRTIAALSLAAGLLLGGLPQHPASAAGPDYMPPSGPYEFHDAYSRRAAAIQRLVDTFVPAAMDAPVPGARFLGTVVDSGQVGAAFRDAGFGEGGIPLAQGLVASRVVFLPALDDLVGADVTDAAEIARARDAVLERTSARINGDSPVAR